MGEWISKAANVFKRDVSDAPQPFEIYCECGQKHTGVRRVRHQNLICKACGTTLFILPCDTYPPPHAPQSSPAKKKRRKKSAAGVAEVLDLSPEEISPPTSIDEDTSSRRRRQRDRAADANEPERRSRLASAWNSSKNYCFEFIFALWNFWTPYRKLALVIAILLLLTAAYSLRQNQLRNAGVVSKTEMEAGLSEMGAKNWVEARRHMQEAANAVQLLGRTDVEANTILQYARELTALTRLTAVSLFDVSEDAESTYVKHGIEKWDAKFASSYRNAWCIIEGYLRPTTDADQIAEGYELELVYPLTVGDKQRDVQIFVSFQQAINLPSLSPDATYDEGNGSRAVFAAQLEDCSIDINGKWAIRLNPETSFFWVNRPTYEATHLSSGSLQPIGEQQQMFDLQAKWMGVKP